MVVYVLLFNARTENEGIHTLKVDDHDVVLMFENEDDATRFGLMLEAQDFPEATVEAIDQAEIEEFCQDAGYDCKLVPEGALAVPPDRSVEATDWNPDAPPEPQPTAEKEAANTLSQQELDRLRQQFEKLL
ncbi:DUF3110 domain-containing protein [Nodosilinea sp. P-1105]|uniref:DUF3110 domain-containing protein n=1 Tax=Nodosilinea sp. P-1105 TaxID=2546229 RepID=UPI00146B8E9D|nr:DUF3110 domain-containing protein [Nodosilinea sp. P-1105]NMF83567.1 DUF3110 domain-containing protein [Nodosilinea sp. P-1105]